MPNRFQRTFLLVFFTGILIVSGISTGSRVSAQPTAAAPAAQSPVRTPTETAKFVYQSLAEKKFREAFAVSVFKPAIDALSDADFNELLPEFEAMAADANGIEYTGEEVTGDHATVFVKVPDDSGNPLVSAIQFVKRNGQWIYGDAETEAAVLKDGKNYFFNIRIQTHEADVRELFKSIVKAQIVHSAKNNGVFGDLKTLVSEELLPEDILGTRSTGYKFSLTLSKDGKAYAAAAEPEHYGRTGKLSFYLENSMLNSKDNGGKPLKN